MRVFNWVSIYSTIWLIAATRNVLGDDSEGFQPKVNKIDSNGSIMIEAFDDSTTILRIEDHKLVISNDDGAKWDFVRDVKEDIAWLKVDDFYPKKRAIVQVKDAGKFYMTDDQGRSWRSMDLKLKDKLKPNVNCELATHPFKKEYLSVSCIICEEQKKPGEYDNDIDNNKEDYEAGLPQPPKCEGVLFASNNEGKTFNEVQLPSRKDNKNVDFQMMTCEFARKFKDSKINVDDATIICSYHTVSRSRKTDNNNNNNNGQNDQNEHHNHEITSYSAELFYTKDFGKTVNSYDKFKDMTISGFQILKSYIIVGTQDDSFNRMSPKKLWVSTDGISFTEAYFPSQIRYSIEGLPMEDDNGRIILPVRRSEGDQKYNMATEVFVSDSTGMKFSAIDKTLNKGRGHTVYTPLDFLKGAAIIDSYSSLRHLNQNGKQRSKKISSKITVDNGVSWQNLKIVDPGNEDQYDCNIADTENCYLAPFMFSTVNKDPTAGILLMVGSVSDGTNTNFDSQATFLSRDGGLSWKKMFDFPVTYATGDYGNVIVAVPFNPEEDEDPASEIYYSLDQGDSWTEYQLAESMVPMQLFPVTKDGSGHKFLLSGTSMNKQMLNNPFSSNLVYTIDFADAFDKRQCEDSDFEMWELNNGECISGAKYSYKRRKQNSECLVRKTYEDLVWKEEICALCAEDDYECSFEFVRDENGKCRPDFNLLQNSDSCKGSQKELKLLPKKLIKGDKCKQEMKVDPVIVICGDLPEPVKDGSSVFVTENKFDNTVVFYQYFESSDEETILFGDERGNVHISHDGGQNIEKVETDGEFIREVVFNRYFNSSAYLFGHKNSLFVTHDRGHSFSRTTLPQAIQLGFPLDFHAEDKNTFIYYGGQNCNPPSNPDCHSVAYITRDGGNSFEELLSNSIHCEFAGSQYKHAYDKNLIICQVRDRATNKRLLISSTDFFQNDKNILFDDIIGYMSGDGYSVVAVAHAGQELRAFVTQDGHEFAEAKLPQELEGLQQETFTILGSQLGSIFMHMNTNNEKDYFFGSLLKSNSNGTSFVTMEKYVNRNNIGLVDFEKVQGLEGIILINTVSNPEAVQNKEDKKKLKTEITFNDGSDWTYLRAPQKDSDGKKYQCNSKDLEKCSLNLHGFSEAEDLRDTYSSGSALGMMFANGNVGPLLLPIDECSTFFTSDGGYSWTEVAKGPHQWEYGDHGGVLVIVPSRKATNSLKYSLDSGKSWIEYQFTENEVVVQDIVTVPEDSALRFLLITTMNDVGGQASMTFTIDFRNSFARQCIFDINDEKHDDFDYVDIMPSNDQCLFGHKEVYLTKIYDDCYVGNIPLSDFAKTTKICACTRQDFECDYNYAREKDGTCKLVEGLTPAPASDICKLNEDLIEFAKPTGYRKIPLSTCKGGLKLDATSGTFPCPGKEKEFKEKYNVSGSSFLNIFLFFFIVSIIIGWVVYDRGIRRNGGFARFGEIRLGDEALIENNNFDRGVNTVVRGGLFAVSGLYTAGQLLKRSLGGFTRNIHERFSSRSGPSYSNLMHDQFLDEADDLLAGHDEDANDLASFIDSESNFDIEDEESSAPSVTENTLPYTDNDVTESPVEAAAAAKTSGTIPEIDEAASGSQDISPEESDLGIQHGSSDSVDQTS